MNKKPAPDLVYLAMEEIGATKDNTVYIGDSEVDAITGANAGEKTVCVTGGFRTEEELKEEIIPKTDFRYEDTRVVITAYAKEEAGFTQETVLKADYIQKGTSLYKETVDTVTSQMQAKNQEFLDFVCYDVYFEIDVVRVEPEAGLVTVQMEYKQPQFADVAGEATEYATYHINGETNVVEDVTEVIETNKDGAVTSVEFSTK